jgi:squalene cyclase
MLDEAAEELNDARQCIEEGKYQLAKSAVDNAEEIVAQQSSGLSVWEDKFSRAADQFRATADDCIDITSETGDKEERELEDRLDMMAHCLDSMEADSI